MELKKYTIDGKESGSVTLQDEVFASPSRSQTVLDVVKAQLNNERQGTNSTKTRAEVAGGGRKPWRQKGTGRARAGSIRSPLWPGGGATFGPRPRIYDHRPPKKVVDRALKSVLTDLIKNDRIKVIDNLQFSSGKTQDVISFLKKIKMVHPEDLKKKKGLSFKTKALFVVTEVPSAACGCGCNPKTPASTEVVMTSRAVGNLTQVKIVTAHQVNVVDLLRYGQVAISEKALKMLEEVLSK